jgi:glycopeptide antibiotics resistance protein
MLLIMAPTLAMAWLAGWRPALLLAVILSAAIEIAQTAFGYGFDRTDAIDLVCDAMGIAAAMITYQVIARKWRVAKA